MSSGSLRTPICRRLNIDVPIFGFSHSVDVTVAIAESGGFPVFGVARENPSRITEEIVAIRKRLGSRPFGVDLMYPKLDRSGVHGTRDNDCQFRVAKIDGPTAWRRAGKLIKRAAGVHENRLNRQAAWLGAILRSEGVEVRSWQPSSAAEGAAWLQEGAAA